MISGRFHESGKPIFVSYIIVYVYGFLNNEENVSLRGRGM